MWNSGATWRYTSSLAYPTTASLTRHWKTSAECDTLTPLAAAVVPEVKHIRAAPHGGRCNWRGAPRCLAISWPVAGSNVCCGMSSKQA